MNKICYLLVFFLLFSCKNTTEEVLEKFPSGKTKVLAKYIVKGDKKIKKSETKFFENGKTEVTGKYNEEGKREGLWQYWYDNGKLWSECEYKNGLQDGLVKIYFKNGLVKYEGLNKDNKPAGQWIFYSENGEIQKKINYSQ